MPNHTTAWTQQDNDDVGDDVGDDGLYEDHGIGGGMNGMNRSMGCTLERCQIIPLPGLNRMRMVMTNSP